MSDIERRLEELGVGSNDDTWEWFDADAATAPERETDPDEARKHHDPEWLHKEYLEKGRSAAEIADEIGVSKGAVKQAIARHRLQRKHYIHRDSARDRNLKCYSDDELRETVRTAADAVDGTLTVGRYQYWRERADAQQPALQTISKRLGDGSWREARARALDSEGDHGSPSSAGPGGACSPSPSGVGGVVGRDRE